MSFNQTMIDDELKSSKNEIQELKDTLIGMQCEDQWKLICFSQESQRRRETIVRNAEEIYL